MIPLALLAAVSLDAAALTQTSAALNALGPHPFGSPRNQAAAQFVAAKLKDAGLAETTLSEFTAGETSGVNVIATLRGRTDRILIVATHHDSKEDALDIGDRSRSLALLVEIARPASRLSPAHTFILASFDGGLSKGEGFRHYLDGLGPSRALVDGVVWLEASALADPSSEPALIVPACAGKNGGRGLAGRDFVAAAVGGVPEALGHSFDDPGISLLTQPFIRAFRTECETGPARAVADGINVIVVTDRSYSRSFTARPAGRGASPPARDEGAARLGAVALAVVEGLDVASPAPVQSDSWLVVGRSVWPGWLVFLLGMLTLAPGLFVLRGQLPRLGARALMSLVFAALLYFEPEIAVFAGALANLAPPTAPLSVVTLALAPLGLLLTAGGLGFLRGQVIGVWPSPWWWVGLLAWVALLYAGRRAGRKGASRSKRGKRS